jgi:hypothetical protein
LRDILERLFTHRLKVEGEFVLNLVVDAAGDGDAARFSCRLDPGRNIDTVTQQITALHNDIAQIDADTELQPFLCRQVLVSRVQRGLDLRGTAHGLDRTRELSQQRIPGRVENTPAVHLDQGFENFTMAAKHPDCTFLGASHQPAVAGDVGVHDGGDAPLNTGARISARKVVVFHS